MPSPEERRQLEAVNGLRGPAPPWTKKPTAIAIPSNTTSIYQSQSKGGNPFARNPNNRSRKSELNVGDKISRSNLTGILRDDDVPSRPPKRRRTDRERSGIVDYTYSSGGVHMSPNRSSSSRPPHAPDTVNIVEHDNHEAEIDDERLTTKHKISFPDELNIVSQPSTVSKYPFSRQSALVQQKHKTSHIVPDGSDTERAMEKYCVGDSDDPIEDPDEPMPTRKGPARQEGERLDQIHVYSPKIDLARMQKPLNKARSMKPKHIKPPDSQVKRNTTNPDALQFDRIAVSQTPLSKESGPLPIEEAYLEDRHLSQSKGQKLQMFWDPNAVSVRIDEKTGYRLWLTPATCETVVYSETSRSTPVLQLRPVNGQGFVTLRFNINDPNWSPKLYEKFMKMASKVVKVETIKNPEVIWDLACRLSGEHKDSGATSKSKEPSRLEILRGIEEKKKSSLQPHPETRKRKSSLLLPPSSPLTDSPSSQEAIPESKSKSKTIVQKNRRATVTNSSSYPRRSARNAPSEKTQTKGSDELILVYPPGPGAVNITQGDLNRLDPEEYLNDTLIEFGLKMWLKNLAESDPVLASEIHIFNSFFYKKLNHCKDVQQAFESVKKWTSKFDIFKKKYVIVPINEHFHWYLAIICEPEHVLSGRSSRISHERKKTRSTAQAEVSVSGTAPSQNDNEDERDDQNVTSSEAEVERNLNHEFQSSCTIETHDFDPGMPFDATDDDDTKSLEALSYVTDDGEEFQRSKIDDLPSTSASMRPGDSRDRNVSPTPSYVDMVVDSTEETSALPNHVPIQEPDPLQPQYRVKTRKGKGKDAPGYDIVMMENDIEETASAKSQQRTYIFIMDSLGTRHPQAVRKLSKYLVMEAQDKKGISDAAEAEGRFALVPVQPNFCDCGLYLLHFAQTFMTDPSFYTKNILSQAKHIPNQERQQTWKDNEVAQMRNKLGQEIRLLSKSWKKERKGDEGKEPPDCDDDIEIVSNPETEKKPAMSAKNGKNQAAKPSKANRLRG